MDNPIVLTIEFIFDLIGIALPIAIIVAPIVLIAKAIKRALDIAQYKAETERMKATAENHDKISET